MNVPLLDLKAQYKDLKTEIDAAVANVLDHCGFILGPEVKLLEKELAEYCQADHAVGVASGTDALLLALRAVGVGEGDEVITTSFSFFATCGVISRLGARPVFCDIEEETFNIDPSLIESKINSKTKAIMPVHLFGQIADMDSINAVASSKKLPVIEDSAQAIGAKYKNKPAGTLGTASGFSFYPSKNLGAYGDGGFISTNSEQIDQFLRILRVQGHKPKYYNRYIGYNSRLDTMQAAILLIKLKYLDKWHELRRKHAAVYDRELAGVGNIKTPRALEHNYHIYNQYTLVVDDRDKLRDYLKENSIGFDIYYPVPLHLQECYNDLGYKKGELPISEKLAEKVISIPVFPEMTEDQQAYVIESLKKFYKG